MLASTHTRIYTNTLQAAKANQHSTAINAMGQEMVERKSVAEWGIEKTM
jgi:hypothetical protein